MSRPSIKGYYQYSLMILFVVMTLVAIISSTFVLTRTSYVHAAAPKLSIQFTCASAIDNKQGSICVHTQAKAALTIQVKYCTGYYAVSKSLKGTQYADTHGNYKWTWVPQTKCKGAATAYVNEKLGAQSLNATDKFTVK